MNKAELIEALQKRSGDTAAAAKRNVEHVLDIVQEQLKKGNRVSLPGFGTFTLHKRSARNGFNPLTQQKIKIKASKTVKFSVGTKLKALVNGQAPAVRGSTKPAAKAGAKPVRKAAAKKAAKAGK